MYFRFPRITVLKQVHSVAISNERINERVASAKVQHFTAAMAQKINLCLYIMFINSFSSVEICGKRMKKNRK